MDKKHKYEESTDKGLLLKGDEGAEDVDHPCPGVHTVLDTLHCDGNLVNCQIIMWPHLPQCKSFRYQDKQVRVELFDLLFRITLYL